MGFTRFAEPMRTSGFQMILNDTRVLSKRLDCSQIVKDSFGPLLTPFLRLSALLVHEKGKRKQPNAWYTLRTPFCLHATIDSLQISS